MVSKYEIDKQLQSIGFVSNTWNYKEVKELPSIILPGEKIYECVNGWYENGVSLLIGTNFRIILIDKKPLHFLKVEDLRFDMINQIDYAHGIFDASIIIATGNKTLRFRSFNQPRLRRLISMVQHRMAQIKHDISESRTINSATADSGELNQIGKSLYHDAMRSVFGDNYIKKNTPSDNLIDIEALRIAYSKLPLILRDRLRAREILRRSKSPVREF
jgi:hypothetical protein